MTIKAKKIQTLLNRNSIIAIMISNKIRTIAPKMKSPRTIATKSIIRKVDIMIVYY